MPEISPHDRFIVGGLNFLGGHKCAQQIEMARFRFVQTGEQSVDSSQFVRTTDMQTGVGMRRLDAIG